MAVMVVVPLGFSAAGAACGEDCPPVLNFRSIPSLLMQNPLVHSLRIAVLGPLEVSIDGAPVDLGPRKQRAVLGVLTALAPSAVPVERLVDEIWGDAGP